jgi:aspartyl-tRNA synthetase
MSSESEIPKPDQEGEDESSKSASKKAAKKEAAKQEKLRRRQEAALAAAAAASSLSIEEDPLAANYGNIPLQDLQSKVEADLKAWTQVGDLTHELKEKEVLIRGRAQTTRAVGKNMAFVVVREKGFTVQCVVTARPDVVSKQMVKFAAGLSRESIVDIHGVVSVPSIAIKGTTQQVWFFFFFVWFFLFELLMFVNCFLQVEIQVSKLYCVDKAMPTLPINIEDASRSEKEIEEALEV